MAAESIPPPGEYDPARMPEYKPLSAYGLIGDTRSVALVGNDGSMDWLCLPDFDSPAVFAALLDPAAGRFTVRPTGSYHGHQEYEPGTNVLCTEFRCEGGTARLRDFMPMVHERRLPESEIHRQIEAVSGEVELEMVFEPRLDFGQLSTRVEISEYGALAHPEGRKHPRLTLTSSVPLTRSGESACGRFKLRAGQSVWAVLSWEGSVLHPIQAYRCEQRLWRTRQYWHDWLAKLQYHGDYGHMIRRSLLTLKLLTYSNTGAMVAAATASLPEWAGGQRNWDYRYAWVRDSSFMLRALFTAGFIDEGTAYLDWLLKRCAEDKTELRTLYSVRADSDLRESELPLRGWRDSRPVRIGNAASDQFQLDIYGSLIDAALHYQNSGGVLTVAEAETLMQLVERVRASWREPDNGVWETRGVRQHYTYSKTWAWVALTRGAELAQKTGLDVDLKLWQQEADELQREVLARAWNPTLKAFTQAYDSEVLDASVLVMPITGIVKPDDPRFISTREAVIAKLTAGRYPLLYRYDHQQVDDGVGGKEGAFLLPSFWLVEGLIMAGRHDEARAAFTALVGYASPLGLLSEQIDPEHGTLLGNLPQGFSHLGLINAALRLEASQDELRPNNVGRAAAFSSSRSPISE
jgi:GH15 family glucan-1,4-alpha-glucosidase